jgi:tripartite-type tricarboxylate transporter receptor subunit TctC
MGLLGSSYGTHWVRAGALLALTVLSGGVGAQAYPTKPVRLIAPFPAGGSSDLVARIVGQKLGEGFGQQLVIDNRPGAGANLGTQIAARAAADGYTLLICSVTTTINISLYKNPGYALNDFTPISRLAIGPTALVVHPAVAAKSVAELIALAKARPGRLNYGSGGTGTPAHIIGEVFKHSARVDITHVPYKGTGQSVNDLIAGQIQIVFASMPVAFPHMKTGRLRALAVTGANRTPLAPDLPTIAESGVPGFAFDSWWGMLAPAGTPPAIIGKLDAALRRAVALEDVKARLADLGVDAAYAPPSDFGNFMRTEAAKVAKIIRETPIRVE